MCVIISKSPEAALPDRETLAACWRKNPDGAGIMWSEDGRLCVRKGLMTLRELAIELDAVPECSPLVIHFRMATHGSKGQGMTHPFIINPELAVVHNGIIHSPDYHEEAEDGESDTAWYVRTRLRQLAKGFYRHHNTLCRIEREIGWSRLVFLDARGRGTICNERAGTWMAGCWYSNLHWLNTYNEEIA